MRSAETTSSLGAPLSEPYTSPSPPRPLPRDLQGPNVTSPSPPPGGHQSVGHSGRAIRNTGRFSTEGSIHRHDLTTWPFYANMTSLHDLSVSTWPFCPYMTFLSLHDLSALTWLFCPYMTFLSLHDLSALTWLFCPYMTFLSVHDLLPLHDFSVPTWPFCPYMTFLTLMTFLSLHDCSVPTWPFCGNAWDTVDLFYPGAHTVVCWLTLRVIGPYCGGIPTADMNTASTASTSTWHVPAINYGMDGWPLKGVVMMKELGKKTEGRGLASCSVWGVSLWALLLLQLLHVLLDNRRSL